MTLRALSLALVTGAVGMAWIRYRARTFRKRAVLLRDDAAGLEQAGAMLRAGRLVAFPTETVYGLGANALNPAACRDIFKTKGRPLTDPLIVHVTTVNWAQSLLSLSERQTEAFQALAKTFWPGPLTIVAEANLKVFSKEAVEVLTANTGMVGVRVPSSKVACALIDKSGVPIAAPSANRFGHVSPTSAQHVMDDLGDFPVFVIETNDKCNVGIESTVVGLGEVDLKMCIVLFRRGGVSESQLQKVISPLGLSMELAPSLVRGPKPVRVDEAIPQVAPGQLLTHYAPYNVETFIWERDENGLTLPYLLAETVIVDFGGLMKDFKTYALAYRDLSDSGNVDEACKAVFDALRWTEEFPKARAVLLPHVVQAIQEGRALALDDRLYRAASGRRVGRIKST